jgi:RNA polymerase sigma-70 factor (ECF subfamily)
MSDAAEPVQKIVEELQAGISVEENFRLLCDLYHRPLYHFFAKRGFPPDDCLDLTQETFIGIYRSIGSFRSEARFETWLFKVATNAFRKRLRWGTADKRSGQEVSLSSNDDDRNDCGWRGWEERVPATGPEPAEGALRKERRRLLREAVERLPAQMRKCLILRVYHELKYREIGTVLRLSPETVKVHLFQARRRLQSELGEHFRDAVPEEAAS